MSEEAMQKKGTRKYKLILAVFALVFLMIMILLSYTKTASKNYETEKNPSLPNVNRNANATFSILMRLKYGEDAKEYSVNNVSEQVTVFDVLKKAASENNFELSYNNNYSYGVFVESISVTKNGDGGKYWQYYINGFLGDVAADKKVLKKGDAVEWRFEKVPEL